MVFESPYSYMPKGSYGITVNNEVIFFQEIPEELKKRFLEDVKRETEKRRLLEADMNAYLP